VSCGDQQDTGNDISDGESSVQVETDNDHIETYIYRAMNVPLPENDYLLQASLVYKGRVFLCFGMDPTEQPTSVVMSLNIDGSDVQYTEINFHSETHVVGFDVTNDGNIALFAVTLNEERTIFYAEYNQDGVELFKQDFSGLFEQIAGWHEIHQAVFSEGNIAVSRWNGDVSEIYLLSIENESLTKLILDHRPYRNSIVRMHEERIVVLDIDNGALLLREIDFDKKDLGEVFPVVPVDESTHYDLFPVWDDSSFDFLMSDGSLLYGYCTKTHRQKTLLNWIEVGFSNVLNVGALEDGKFVVLSDSRSGHGNQSLNLYVLQPSLRVDIKEKVELTLGGVWITEEIRSAVAAFNRENQHYRIEVEDYGADDYHAGVQRLRIELMTGRGPDILYDQFGILTNNDLLLDLYPFIDADPELARSDFFPNMLSVLESRSGKLPLFANSFGIFTMIGTAESVGHIQTWTPSALLDFVEANSPLLYPLGPQLTSKMFIMLMLSYAGPEFIDWENHEANIDSENFISLLNASTLLSEPHDENIYHPGFADPQLLMLRGEQLVELTNIGPITYQFYSDVLGDIVVLGIPTNEGGVHILEQNWLMGINGATNHADGAWEFLRTLLLPTAIREPWLFPFPLRIDLYDELVAELMDLDMWEADLIDEDGNFHHFDIHAVTEESAKKMRDIVESASVIVRRVHRLGLWEIIERDLDSFFAGNSSAEDTARIIQSRVQIFLSEQG
jgi:hypothetical protein